MNFHQGFHFQRAAERKQFFESSIAENCSNQKKRIGTRRTRFPYLPRVNDEILAQDRNLRRTAGFLQIAERAMKEILLRQHRERRSTG